ncbi:MAG TPA: HAMP domain-containing sensor histidine kinase [Gemmataceae bacterium]
MDKIMMDTDPIAELKRGRRRFWRYARILIAPLLLWGLVVVALRLPLQTWLDGEKSYDEAVLHEWLDEARGYRGTLREMVEEYLARAQEYARLRANHPDNAQDRDVIRLREILAVRHEEIYEQLRTLGSPPTKRDAGQLPLFPIIYRLQVRFHVQGSPLADLSAVPLGDNGFLLDAPITWDSGLPSDPSQFQFLEHDLLHPYTTIDIRYQLHAYNKRQRIEQAHHQRLNQLSALAIAGTVLSLTWMVVVQRRERERERLLLQAERRHAETERQLLEQRLATQAAERQALELKSQMWASIGIMAGSYAHNIKNLLVRPNDLLRRCLDADNVSPDQASMLNEVQHTLGTVTERLQQILHTVRRDPSQAEASTLDLNAVVSELEQTWKELAREKWKLELMLEIKEEPLWISGDISHLQQAIENLLFNARDATFEMRNHLRDRARQAADLDTQGRRQALIAAAAWRGRVVLRTLRREQEVVLEVCDNGAGMNEDVRHRCTETHFSTKRDNAIYEGHSTGMGLGLSFVVAVLEHHRARLEIDSEPKCGTTFRICFPAATAAAIVPRPLSSTSEESSA